MNEVIQPLLQKYGHITTEEQTCSLSLNREQQLVLLYAYDYGTKALTPEMLSVLDSVINDLKDAIHP